MNSEINNYILEYGYFAIFALIFVQEIGIPNPIPNELVLAYSGYLCSQGTLKLPFVILASISADVIGTILLYITFYYLGDFILKNKPKWFPISDKTLERVAKRVTDNGLWAIYLGRVTPFIRGYTSVITGLLKISFNKFLPIVFLSALTWSSVCVFTGRFMGAYWTDFQRYFQAFKPFVILLIVLIVIFIVFRYFRKHRII